MARRRSERKPFPPGYGIIWSTVAIDLVGFGMVTPILPQYAERFGMSGATIGMLFASFSLAQLVFAPVWGRLSDRIGRKPVIVISLFGTALGSLLTGVAGTVWLLFLGRLVDGASGASVSVAQASVADVAGEEDRPRLMGMLGAAFGVGFVAGPALGALAALGGPHIPFYVAAVIAFVNAVVAIGRLPETHPTRDAEEPDPVLSLDGPGLDSPSHIITPHGTPDSIRYVVVRLIVIAFVAMVAFSGFEATFALLAERRFGLTISSTSAVFAVIGIALVAVQGGMVGPVTTKLGESATLRFGLVANCLGLLVLAVDGGWTTLVVALALLVTGQGLLTPTLTSAVAGRAGSMRGIWLGWQQSAGGVARVVGPIVAGPLFDHVGVGAPYVAGAVLAVLALMLVPSDARRGQGGKVTAR